MPIKSRASNPLANKMFKYENPISDYIDDTVPLMIKVSGVNFTKFCEGLETPFDPVILKAMGSAAAYACNNIPGVKIAYQQCDEIIFLVDNRGMIGWTTTNASNIAAIACSIVTNAFGRGLKESFDDHFEKERQRSMFNSLQPFIFAHMKDYRDRFYSSIFRAKAFTIPQEEIIDYFIGCQINAGINSVNMLCKEYLSEKERQNLTYEKAQKFLSEKEVNWDRYPKSFTRGTCTERVEKMKEYRNRPCDEWVVDDLIPIFSENKSFLEERI